MNTWTFKEKNYSNSTQHYSLCGNLWNIEQILNFTFITISIYTLSKKVFTPFGPIYRLSHGEEELIVAQETIKQSHFYKTLNS